ncbi:MAG: amidohydrolase, partial [Candidatus Marinimicrobia bacterium]|nr:amidohydrolase [Candidatus Neomarinimicrobiota bacterium]
MLSILIKNVLMDSVRKDILIRDGVISSIEDEISFETDRVLNGSGKAVVPSFVNAHTHSAMTLFRSYADDMHLN